MTKLRAALADYLEFRRRLGTRLSEPGVTLSKFVDFVEAQGMDWISADCAIRWATMPRGVQTATCARRLTHVRGFARWLKALDPRTEIPAHRLLSSRHRRSPPYIYSDVEVLRLIRQAARMPSRSRLLPERYATLIGLIASTGLRPGEALALEVSDVDFGQGTLSVRNSKFGKSRFVPFSESTGRALKRYIELRQAFCRPGWSDALFVSLRGSRLNGFTARKDFALLCQAVGIRTGSMCRRGRGPRLQDIRHTFATRRLIEWYRAGVDVTRKMPALSTYLGHGSVHATYWYIQAVPELLQCAAERSAMRAGATYP
jgi:integrase